MSKNDDDTEEHASGERSSEDSGASIRWVRTTLLLFAPGQEPRPLTEEERAEHYRKQNARERSSFEDWWRQLQERDADTKEYIAGLTDEEQRQLLRQLTDPWGEWSLANGGLRTEPRMPVLRHLGGRRASLQERSVWPHVCSR